MDPGQGRGGGAEQLCVRGRLDISRARRLHGQLVAALDRAGAVTLEVADGSMVDLSFLQLVCAARRTAAARGAGFHVAAASLPDQVRRLVRAIGAEGGPGDPDAAPRDDAGAR